ncbi:uncharacterized protein LOC128875067 [Hylaeus volcanicus]|uniref:uncharacterized protein LOC128875067 n=1 Tax=Hylaeus volcanicus TaxID=313075 RepID=UPI0023B7B98D|nr:uncharacterized protein LOC128875067 [Hylaeus volcanicus]
MQTLELHFGDKRLVAQNVINDMNAMPDLDSGRITLMQFSTKLRNAVVALNALKCTGYLHSPDLVSSVAGRMPSALKYAFNRYVAEMTEPEPELEMLADFMFREAQFAATAEVFSSGTSVATGRPAGEKVKKAVRLARIEMPKRSVGQALRGSRLDASVPNLSLLVQSVSEKLVHFVKSREDVDIRPYINAQPKLLIGQNNWELIVSRELRELEGSGVVLSCSWLGWIPHGTTDQLDASRDVCAMSTVNRGLESVESVAQVEDERLDDMIRFYFSLDSLEVYHEARPNKELGRALKTLTETTKRVEGGWETGLLWKETRPLDVDSKTTARKRLASLEKRLDRVAEYARLYYAEMRRLIENGYARKVDKKSKGMRSWYLPHFGVQNVNKPGKVRLVFDAAAKTAGVSLNDQLDSGPDLLRSLTGVLLRFRQHAIAFKGYIQDMFLRVKVRENDRNAQTFLCRGSDRSGESDEYQMTCLVFGAKSSPCSAMFVKNKNAETFSECKPVAAKSVVSDCYMDDYLASRRTVTEARNVIRDVVQINANAGFAMHGLASNDARALETAVTGGKSGTQWETRLCDRGGERVLGLFWDTQLDELAFNAGLSKIPERLRTGVDRPTSRELLRVIMSVFDPLGFLTPFTLISKILMQDVWRSGIGWDSELRDEEHVGWQSWIRHLHKVRACRIPRCYALLGHREANVELHVFSDASPKACAAVAYLRFVINNEASHVALVMAKAKVAPLKPLSVLRLELQAALLGSRLAKMVSDELNINVTRRYMWTDSTTVLRWIKTEPRMRQVYVAHRLGEIEELTQSTEWRWVPSKLNPADDATKWKNRSLHKNDRWFVGPEFLRGSDSSWPVEKPLDETEKRDIGRLELRKAFAYVVSMAKMSLPTTAKFLGWLGLLVVGRRVKNATDRWRRRRRANITIADVISVESFWIRRIQMDCFAAELEDLKKKGRVKTHSKIASLRPFIDVHHFLRASGRVTTQLDAEFRNDPIILDNRPPSREALGSHLYVPYHEGGAPRASAQP